MATRCQYNNQEENDEGEKFILYIFSGDVKGLYCVTFVTPILCVCVYMIIIQKKEGRRRYKKKKDSSTPAGASLWKLFLLLLCQLHRGSLCVDCVYTHTSPSNIHSCCHKTFFFLFLSSSDF